DVERLQDAHHRLVRGWGWRRRWGFDRRWWWWRRHFCRRRFAARWHFDGRGRRRWGHGRRRGRPRRARLDQRQLGAPGRREVGFQLVHRSLRRGGRPPGGGVGRQLGFGFDD